MSRPTSTSSSLNLYSGIPSSVAKSLHQADVSAHKQVSLPSRNCPRIVCEARVTLGRSEMAKQAQRSVAVVAAVVALCVSMAANGVDGESWPAAAPYMRGDAPSSAPGYAPAWAPAYAPAGSPLGSPMSAPLPYVFVPSPSITIYEPVSAPGPMSAR